jgi:hypothetical protein
MTLGKADDRAATREFRTNQRYNLPNRRLAMNDVFEKRVRAAAVAGWWTLLIAVGFLLIQWIGYLLVMSAHPTWMLSLWGPDITWSFFQTVWFWGIAIMKVSVWPLALAALWLTLWARQLRKRAERVEVENGK